MPRTPHANADAACINSESIARAELDRRFVDRCIQGDPHAWDDLYDRYHGGLVASIRLMFGRRNWDPNLVDEIAARVWYQLVADNARLLDRFEPSRGCRLTTFLATIAKSEATKFFRSERRRRHRERIASRLELDLYSTDMSLSDVEIQEFFNALTHREREFLAEFLLAPVDQQQTYSNANRWQLSSRIQSKLRQFLLTQVG